VAAQVPVDEAARVRLQTFDQVWNTVNEKHYDPTFGGVDWNEVRAAYSPKAAAAKSDDELNAILRQMLNELKLSHFGIFPKDLETRSAGAAGIGVELKMIGGEPVVWRVDPGSTAEAAGLKPGYVVRKINDTAVGELLKPLDAALEARHMSEALRKLYRERTLEAFMSGAPDTPAVVEVASENGKIVAIRAIRKPFKGELSQPIGNFPGQRVLFESKRVNGNIGYIRFNMWVIPQLARLRAAVREFSDTRAIIFDLRGNPGGLGGMAREFALARPVMGDPSSWRSHQRGRVRPPWPSLRDRRR